MKWFNELPWYAKVGLVLLALFILYYFVYNPIKAKIQATNYQTPVNEAQTSLNQLAQQGVKPSYSQTEYSTSANALETLFQGCTMAEDAASSWNTLSGIFAKMKNEADIYALIKAYGVRKTDRCGVFNGDNNSDLGTTLTDHFSGFEQYKLGHTISDINAILKANGIQYSF